MSSSVLIIDFISCTVKSAETLSLVKHDLAEFVTTIQHDTTVTVAETAHNVKEKLKVNVSFLI